MRQFSAHARWELPPLYSVLHVVVLRTFNFFFCPARYWISKFCRAFLLIKINHNDLLQAKNVNKIIGR